MKQRNQAPLNELPPSLAMLLVHAAVTPQDLTAAEPPRWEVVRWLSVCGNGARVGGAVHFALKAHGSITHFEKLCNARQQHVRFLRSSPACASGALQRQQQQQQPRSASACATHPFHLQAFWRGWRSATTAM